MLTWWIDSHLNNKTKVFDETVFFLCLRCKQSKTSSPLLLRPSHSSLVCPTDNVYIFFSFSNSQPHLPALHTTTLQSLANRRETGWTRGKWNSVLKSLRVAVECRVLHGIHASRTLRCRFLFLCNSSKEKEEETNRSGIDTQAARSVEQQENNWIKWYVDLRPADYNNDECLKNKLIPATTQGAKETKNKVVERNNAKDISTIAEEVEKWKEFCQKAWTKDLFFLKTRKL